jgi:hypothetical protein
LPQNLQGPGILFARPAMVMRRELQPKTRRS